MSGGGEPRAQPSSLLERVEAREAREARARKQLQKQGCKCAFCSRVIRLDCKLGVGFFMAPPLNLSGGSCKVTLLVNRGVVCYKCFNVLSLNYQEAGADAATKMLSKIKSPGQFTLI